MYIGDDSNTKEKEDGLVCIFGVWGMSAAVNNTNFDHNCFTVTEYYNQKYRIPIHIINYVYMFYILK